MHNHLISSLAWRWKLTMGGCCLDCIWRGERHNVGEAHLHFLCRIGDVCHVVAALARWGSVSPSVGFECATDWEMHLDALFI